jgi:NAD(P)-dependent dehydrogenase (short-subunit alcohol dehydrogenase family)
MIDDNPVCLLTGASGLLGTAFCQRYAMRYRIVGVWHTNPLRVPTQDQRFIDPLTPQRPLGENAYPVFAIRADLRSPRQTEQLVSRVLRRFGQVDLVVNAAAYRHWSPFVEDTNLVAHADLHFATNVRAPLQLAVALVRQSWSWQAAANRTANRSVINLSSTAGLRAYPGYGQGLYSASKAALHFVTSHLAAELGPIGVRVNALAPNTFPGIVTTELVLDRIFHLAKGSMTGKILLLDARHESWHDPATGW